MIPTVGPGDCADGLLHPNSGVPSTDEQNRRGVEAWICSVIVLRTSYAKREIGKERYRKVVACRQGFAFPAATLIRPKLPRRQERRTSSQSSIGRNCRNGNIALQNTFDFLHLWAAVDSS